MDQHVPFQQPPAAGSPTEELAAWLALVRRMAAATASLRKTLTEAGSARFGETEQLVLWHCYLAAEDGLGQSELVAALGCSPAQISSTVERLRRQGQLRSRRSSRDRRRQSWSLTTAGTNTVAEWLQPIGQLLGRFSAGLPASELARLNQLLETLEHAADSTVRVESSHQHSAPRQEAA